MNHIEVLMEYKYMQKSLTQALTTLSRLSLIENKPALLRTEDLLVKFKEATTKETWVPAVYLKMTDKTRQKMAESFSEGMF